MRSDNSVAAGCDTSRPCGVPWRRALVLVLLLAGGAALVATVGVPPVEEIRSWARQAGWAGPVLFAALYAGLSLTPAPVVVLSIGAGVLFGLPVAAGSVLVGALGGAAIGFGLARVLGRATVRQLGGDRLARLDEMLRRRGVLAVIVVRLVPLLPFTTLNYACGLTAVRARDYLLGTALGIVPGTLAYVTIGAFEATPGSAPVLLALGGLAVLAVAGVVTARRRDQLGHDVTAPPAELAPGQ